YVQDYDEMMFGAWWGVNGDSAPGTAYKWMDVLNPYIKSNQLFDCPSRKGQLNSYIPASGQNWGSYRINCAYWAGGIATGAGRFHSIARVQAPASTLWFIEGSYNHFEVAWENVSFNPVPGVSGGIPALGQAGLPHFDTANVTFCDGHVKPVRMDDLIRANPNNNVYSIWSVEED
ncbi:MAG TPA: hypothetical protein DCZ72_06160, partial [Armatimonadetes bacterium]|nr:hypothetical protein [Armatimonadota bacterium]